MPDGVGPGTTLLVTAPDGRQAKVELPDGVHPGDERDFYVGTSLETSALFPRHPTPRADELNPMDRGAILQSVRIVGQNRAGTPPRLSRGDRQLTPTQGSVRASQTPRASRSSTPMQPAVRAELGQLGLGTLRKQAVLEGATYAQIEAACDSDNAKQQIIEMVVQAQSDKVAAAEMAAAEEESQLREQIRLGALVMKRQEQERAVEQLRAELTGLRLGALQKRARLFGVTSDLVEEAMDDASDAKQALIAICIEAELGIMIQETNQGSPIPTVLILDRPSTPVRLSPHLQGWTSDSTPRDPPPLPSPPRDPPPLPGGQASAAGERRP